MLNSKLPHPIIDEETNIPEVCLIVKDVDKKDRDYERTVRKYTQIVQENNLENVIKKVKKIFWCLKFKVNVLNKLFFI